jgi:Rod binding domain-containing protein
MENYSSLPPLLLSQPASLEVMKNLNQKDVNTDTSAMKKMSQDFESILMSFVIKAMWQTIPKSNLFEENNGGIDTYTEIMHAALAQDITAKGGLGISSVIYQQLINKKEHPEQPGRVDTTYEKLNHRDGA